MISKKMNSKENQTNSEINNIKDESSRYKEKVTNFINEKSADIKSDENSIDIEDKYKFGWGSYSEITNGRFAMIGILAIIIIELFSQQPFLKWAGILN